MTVGAPDLTSDDLHAVLRLVGTLHEAADPDDLAHRLVDGLLAVVGADAISLNDIDLTGTATTGAFLQRGRPHPDRATAPTSGAHRLAISVVTAPGRVVGIALQRWRRPFTPRDLGVAGLVQEHLPAAYDHARLRADCGSAAPGLAALSSREREVLRLVADGRTNRDIARHLFIEPRTVEKHVEHIRAKLGARSRTQAAAMFVRGAPSLH